MIVVVLPGGADASKRTIGRAVVWVAAPARCLGFKSWCFIFGASRDSARQVRYETARADNSANGCSL